MGSVFSRLTIHPRYAKALALRCAKPEGAPSCNPPAVQLLPGAVYYIDAVRMLKVPADYNGPAVVVAPDVMTHVEPENTVEIEGRDVYLNDFKTAASFKRRVEVDTPFNRVASLTVSARILRKAAKSLKKRKVVGIWARSDSAIVFAANSRGRCIDAREVPARVVGTPSPVYFCGRYLKEALGVPGDEVTIEFQDDDAWSPTWMPVKVRLGDTVECIAPWLARVRGS